MGLVRISQTWGALNLEPLSTKGTLISFDAPWAQKSTRSSHFFRSRRFVSLPLRLGKSVRAIQEWRTNSIRRNGLKVTFYVCTVCFSQIPDYLAIYSQLIRIFEIKPRCWRNRFKPDFQVINLNETDYRGLIEWFMSLSFFLESVEEAFVQVEKADELILSSFNHWAR